MASQIPAAAAPPTWWALSAGECLTLAKATPEGLTTTEAQARIAKFGRNTLTPKERPSYLSRVWDQVNSALIWILIAAATVSGFQHDWVECVLISCVVVINVSIGLYQEGQAEEAANALSSMLAPRCTVVRGGEHLTMDAADLVVGDVVFVQSGDAVPADLRMLECTDLQILESMLTGESLAVSKHTRPVPKEAGIGDRKNMAFSATLVQQGQGVGLVVATGDTSAIGAINALVAGEEDKTSSLTLQLESFGRIVTGATVAVGVVAFFLAYLYVGTTWQEAFRASVAIAVAIIPEGLPAVVTITMALGVSEMARQKAIVRKLAAVETLGSVSTVCSDKTGTLTKNEMTAVAVVVEGGGVTYPVSGVGYDYQAGVVLVPAAAAAAGGGEGEKEVDAPTRATLRSLLLSAILPNDGGVSSKEGGGWTINGDPTDVAPLVLFKKLGGDHLASKKEYPVIKAIPFESLHKWQGILVKDGGVEGGKVLHIKGAPERVIPMCSHSLVKGKTVAIDAQLWGEKAAEFASKGLRVLAVARWAPPPQWKGEGEVSVEWASSISPPFLTLVALIAILDPPRPECVTAIAEFHKAGIVVKLITGDHPGTALAIGQKLGLADPTGQVSTGPEVDKMSDSQLAARVLQCNVYARASPDNKIRIVKALQSHGQIVSMTGDGVNDAPSLKAADIGVAMGITGTDVSKEAAKIVLQDDNFSTIVKAVKEGRKVWDNLCKVFLYNLPTNFAQGFVVFFAFVLKFHDAPLTPIQVLYVNMVISVTLGGALSSEVPEEGIMARKPRNASLPLVSPHILLRTLWVTATLVVAILGLYQWSLGQGYDLGRARAGAFTLLVVSSALYGLNCRSLREFALGPSMLRPNLFFWLSFFGVCAVQAAIVHTDGLNRFFSCETEQVRHGQCSPMGKEEWAPILCISVAIFFAVEAEKALVAALSGSGGGGGGGGGGKSVKDKAV